MVIANPIYDTVFKRLMENKRVAHFFVETIIGEQVVDIAMVPQEYTCPVKTKKDTVRDGKKKVKVEVEILSIIRFDFVATIRNADGEYKKVFIEIQKSNKPGDLMRFRTYTDIIGKTVIKQKSKWIEELTHDGYFVQIPHIAGKPRTSLEKLLSIFEQKFFIDDKKTIKDYEYPLDDENIKTVIEVLRHAAADTRTKREMEAAWWEELNEKE
jgi:hypothetical protein